MVLKRYRVSKDGSHEFYTFNERQLFNTRVWLEDTHSKLDKYGKCIIWYKIVEEKYVPDLEKELELFKTEKINQVTQNCTAKDPMTIPVTIYDNTVHDITFVGGGDSATAIRGEIDLCVSLNNNCCKIWDINKKTWEIGFEQATEVMQKIATKYREESYVKNDKIQEILNCTTIEELENVEC